MSDAPAQQETGRMQGALTRLGDAVRRQEASKIYQFPFWPEPDRGVPNELIRSALFAAIQGKHRKIMRGQAVAAHGPYSIEFTGVQLTQTHLDVFEGVMHIARGIHEGNTVRFSAHQLLKLIGRHTGRYEHDWLYLMLQDLTATSVSIKKTNPTTKEQEAVFWGSLIPAGAGDLRRGNYAVQVSRDMIKLFERGFTQIQWEQRRALKQKPLACWLQLYYSSHARPYPVTVTFLREQSGSRTANIRAFRQNLKSALDELKAVGVISAWHIVDDLVHVERVPSPSQQRHLAQS